MTFCVLNWMLDYVKRERKRERERERETIGYLMSCIVSLICDQMIIFWTRKKINLDLKFPKFHAV